MSKTGAAYGPCHNPTRMKRRRGGRSLTTELVIQRYKFTIELVMIHCRLVIQYKFTIELVMIHCRTCERRGGARSLTVELVIQYKFTIELVMIHSRTCKRRGKPGQSQQNV